MDNNTKPREIVLRKTKSGRSIKITLSEKPVHTPAATSKERKPPLYDDYLQTAKWQVVRAEAFRAAGNRYVVCDSPSHLVGHHRTYKNLGNEQPGDVQCLCERCHNLFHNRVSFGRRGNFGKRKGDPRKVRRAAWLLAKPKSEHRERLDNTFDRWMDKD